MTARWKALIELEPVRPLTGSVAVVAWLRPRNGRWIPRRPSGLSSAGVFLSPTRWLGPDDPDDPDGPDGPDGPNLP